MNPLESPETPETPEIEPQLDGSDAEGSARSVVPRDLDEDVLVIEDEEGDVKDAEAPADRD